jgi:ubiquinone/menaquinone biosynthesis C-methylase UbiE
MHVGRSDSLPCDYEVVQCDMCSLRYTRPLPTSDQLAALYRQDYYVANQPRLLSTDLARILFQRSILWQHHRALVGRKPGRLLDVGCGNGDLLAYLRGRGWAVVGTEFSTSARKLARGRGISVHEGELRTIAFPADSFDAVTMLHVLEHVPDPLDELAEVRRILRDGGIVVIEVPNSDSLTFRLFGQQWYPLDVPRHLQHFASETLRRSLEQAGFTIVRRQNFHHWDFMFTFYSVMGKLGILRRLGITTFSTNFKRATVTSQLGFLSTGVLVFLASVPYCVFMTLVTGNSETITITARK